MKSEREVREELSIETMRKAVLEKYKNKYYTPYLKDIIANILTTKKKFQIGCNNKYVLEKEENSHTE